MNDTTPVTQKQYAAAVFAALLSPTMRLVPRVCAAVAGRGAWLSVLPALALLLLLPLLMRPLLLALRPGEGMADLILRVYGGAVGRAVLAAYGVWMLFYAGFILRSGAERLSSVVYRQSGTMPFILVMLLLCLPAVMGTFRAAVRTGYVLRGVLLTVLGVSAALALPNIRWDELFPLRLADMPSTVMGALPIAAVGGTAALFPFLREDVQTPAHPVRQCLPPLLLYLLIAALLCLETVGTYGAKLTARLSYPFFTMVRDVTLFGTARRIEAGVVTAWVFADYILCVLLMRCAQTIFRVMLRLPKTDGGGMLRLRDGRWLILPQAAAVLLCSLLPPSSVQGLLMWSERLVPSVCSLFTFGGPAVLLLVGKLRKKL